MSWQEMVLEFKIDFDEALNLFNIQSGLFEMLMKYFKIKFREE